MPPPQAQIHAFALEILKEIQSSFETIHHKPKNKKKQITQKNKWRRKKTEREKRGWIDWLAGQDNNALAEVEEYEFKLKEVQKVCSPIMAKLHQNGSSGNSGHASSGQGPTVEEMD